MHFFNVNFFKEKFTFTFFENIIKLGDDMDFRKVILKAKKEKYAIPQFNFDSLEILKFILEECEKEKSPVFVATSEAAVSYMGGLTVIRNLVNDLIKTLNITVPVMLHLDHGKTVDMCKNAIDAGYDSIMIDASKFSIDQNIAAVQEILNYKDVILECEVGAIGQHGNKNIIYASMEDCSKMIQNTKIFMLAPAIGTVHGLYKGKQRINTKLLGNINQKFNIPLVIHGGSGTKEEIIKECVKNGATKININTELKIALTKAMRFYMKKHKKEIDYRKYYKYAEPFVKSVIDKKIELFGSQNKA